ncbi:MAG: HpcH/HpaI aldolase family protein [Oscillospiraceae bacterium]
MDQYQLKKAFVEGVHTYGTMIASPSPMWVAQIKKIGVDFVFIDLEHMPLDRSQAAWMCQAYRGMGVAPIVRIPSPDPFEAYKALDGGAAGIVVPYLETVEQAQAIRGAVKYRPLKGRKLQDVLYGKTVLTDKESAYLRQYSDGSLLILNIESDAAVDRLDELLAVPDVDAVFIGPHDMSVNIGAPEEYEDEHFARNVEKVIRSCRARQIGVANHFSVSLQKQLDWAALGMDIMLWNIDLVRFVQVMSQEIGQMRRSLGEGAQSDAVIPSF